ncbi:Hsp20/alpha crystallin family protein [Chitinophaga filiformis]|uniref:Hsp20/alpha crystallin family protein n=1 Tax=Chitinophaga filiformis TaxID=104663 RepID=UPI001F1B6BC6|nr:Hsp20/alpha crystallin family protein [Chitinophaga filiformis]MCF6405323.1 Hsp20/alpha crystallin family protein [Chitinophaga filiformis]
MSTGVLKASPLLPAFFDDMFKPWKDLFDMNSGRTWTATVPAVNISEEKDAYKLSLAVPGMTKADFNVDVDGDTLTISAEKEEKKESKDEKISRQEYNYSSFSRSFRLPEGVKRDGISAVYQDGVLKLTLPKKEESKTNGQVKKIEIS